LIAAYGLRRHMNNAGRLFRQDWLRIGIFALLIGGLTFVFYAPWIFSFTSQAGGIYFNIIWATQPQQLFLQFGAFFMLLTPFLGQQARRGLYQINWLGAILVFLALFAVMVILPFAAVAVYDGLCGDNPASSACQARNILLSGATVGGDFWKELLVQRLPAYLSEGFVLAGIVFIGFRLWGRQRDAAKRDLPYEPSTAFALLVVAAGFALILLPDFVYLVDNFRVRINTVFKLYYQAWIFLSVGTAFSIYAVLSRLSDVWTPPARNEQGKLERDIAYPPRASWQLPYMMGLLAILGMGLAYPFYGVRTRALDETGRYAAREVDAETRLTLDGRPTAVSPDEWAVIQCFSDLNPPPNTVIAEAPFNGGYHMEYGRVATLTGVPNLLGWINHEGQWRGSEYDTVTEVVRAENGAIIDSREMQVDNLYRTTDWLQAQAVIARYSIGYIMVGDAERLRYNDVDPYALEKFDDYLRPVCQAGEVKLYQVGS
jgi:hypothetical protein